MTIEQWSIFLLKKIREEKEILGKEKISFVDLTQGLREEIRERVTDDIILQGVEMIEHFLENINS
ncbi:MAG: hypothetical protein ABH956_02170 [Candidatus Nealsonbacteria bacterium]